ncbi:hypothetical protein Tco_0148313, partial [Tanacetum coccineum]
MPAADSPTHQSPGYIPESDPEEDPEEDDEEDPADYPADRGDDDDAEEEEHLAPADPAARDALPSSIHETEIPEMWLPLRIRDTWDNLVGAIQEIAPTTLKGVNQRVIELSSN